MSDFKAVLPPETPEFLVTLTAGMPIPGPPGDPGPTGPPGDSATVTVGTTTTGAPGSPAAVTNTGTENDAVLNFTIPSGLQGPKGDTGIQGPPGTTLIIADEGTSLTSRTTMNFTGAGVTATDDGTRINVSIPGASGGHTIADEGTPLTARTTLNFIGSTVAVTDDAGNNRTNVTISGGSGGGAVSMTVSAFDTETTRGTANPSNRNLVYLTDGLYRCLWNGSAWEYYYLNAKCTRPPLLSSFTWVNQGSVASATETAGFPDMFSTSEGGDHQHCLVRALSGATTVTAMMEFSMIPENYLRGGIVLRESGTGKICLWGHYGDNGAKIGRWTVATPDSGVANFATANQPLTGKALWLRIVITGGNLIFYHSHNGLHWCTTSTWNLAVTTAFTTAPDQYGFGFSINNSFHQAHCSLLSIATS